MFHLKDLFPLQPQTRQIRPEHLLVHKRETPEHHVLLETREARINAKLSLYN